MAEHTTEAKHHLKEAGEHGKAASKEAIAEAKLSAKDAVDHAENNYERIREDLLLAGNEAKEKAEGLLDGLQGYGNKVKDYIGKHPVIALGAAVALGMGLGAMINKNK